MKLNDEVRSILALLQVPTLGAQRVRQLLAHVDHPSEIFSLGRKRLSEINGFGVKIINSILGYDDWDSVDKILAQTKTAGAKLITYMDEDYPPLLRQIHDSPLMLWVLGDTAVLKENSLAVIGTRKPTRYGKMVTENITRDLVANGAVIISGLAYGIDTIAHRTTVDAGGKTIAVLGSGIDWIYPTSNRALARDIVDKGGAVITEYLPGAKPDAGNFPVRNRIVSGMSRGVLVMESGDTGGSLITARKALDQNREVFAVPHQISSVVGSGNNKLIRDSQAKLIQSAEDVFSDFHIARYFEEQNNSESPKTRKIAVWKDKKNEMDELSVQICTLLDDGPLHIDTLSEKLNQRPDQLSIALLNLEFMDCIKPLPGKKFEVVG